MTSTEKDKSRKNSKTIQQTKQTNMHCESRQADRQSLIKFKSEFGKIGETGKYLGMWKLKKLCMCVSLAKNIYIWCLWKIFHTTAEHKRR